MHFKRGPKNSGMGRPPPPLFGQCPKENVFFFIDLFPYNTWTSWFTGIPKKNINYSMQWITHSLKTWNQEMLAHFKIIHKLAWEKVPKRLKVFVNFPSQKQLHPVICHQYISKKKTTSPDRLLFFKWGLSPSKGCPLRRGNKEADGKLFDASSVQVDRANL